MKNTTIPLRKWMALTGLALVALSAAPVNMHFFDGANTKGINGRTLHDIVSGRATDEITRLYNDKFLFRDSGIDLFGMLSYALFREGRRGVLIGADGFLFSAEEFESTSNAQANLAANVDFIVRSAESIEASGAKLLVAVVPAKARIYPEQTGRYVWPSEPESRLPRALDLMQQKHLNVIDLSEALWNGKSESQVFLRTDTHWSSDGAAFAAKAIAAKERGLTNIGEPTSVKMSSVQSADYFGDLTRYIRLGPANILAGPEPDKLVTWTASVGSHETLLGDTVIPVALVGTSYSADPRWSFRAFLIDAFKSDVLDVAAEGKGPFLPMAEYLQSAAFRDTPPKLVIWEIPERYLDDRPKAEAEGTHNG